MAKVTDLPILSSVAAALLGMPLSAGAIEVDFGESGRMLTNWRTSVSNEYIEMCQVINRNFGLVNLGQVNGIPRENVLNYIPKSPEEGQFFSVDADDDDPDEFEPELSQLFKESDLD